MSSTNSSETPATDTVEFSAWPAEGTACYYALRHCPEQVRQHIYAARKLIDSVGYCLLEVSEPSVAEKKIHWWHEEIARLAALEPRHPAAKHYLDFFKGLSVAEQKQATGSLLTVLSCHSEEKFNHLEDQSSFEQLLLTDGSAKQTLMTLAHLKSTDFSNGAVAQKYESQPDAVPVHFAGTQTDITQKSKTVESDDLVLGLSLFHRLASFHKLYHAGLPVWPDSLYQQYNLSPENIKQDDSREKLAELQNNIFEQTLSLLKPAPLSLSDGPNKNLRQHADADLATAIYSAIRLSQVHIWKKHRTNLLEQYRTVTPLKKAWICWRLQRQLRVKRS